VSVVAAWMVVCLPGVGPAPSDEGLAQNCLAILANLCKQSLPAGEATFYCLVLLAFNLQVKEKQVCLDFN